MLKAHRTPRRQGVGRKEFAMARIVELFEVKMPKAGEAVVSKGAAALQGGKGCVKGDVDRAQGDFDGTFFWVLSVLLSWLVVKRDDQAG